MPAVRAEAAVRGRHGAGPLRGLAEALTGIALAWFAVAGAARSLIPFGPATARTVALLVGAALGALVVARLVRPIVRGNRVVPLVAFALLAIASAPAIATAGARAAAFAGARGVVPLTVAAAGLGLFVLGPVAGVALSATGRIGYAGPGVALGVAAAPFVVTAALGPSGGVVAAGILALVAAALRYLSPTRSDEPAKSTATRGADVVAAVALGLACGPFLTAADLSSGGTEVGAVLLPSVLLLVVVLDARARSWEVWTCGVAAAALGRLVPPGGSLSVGVVVAGAVVGGFALARSGGGLRALPGPAALLVALGLVPLGANAEREGFEAFDVDDPALARLVAAAVALLPHDPELVHVVGAGGAPVVHAALEQTSATVTWVSPRPIVDLEGATDRLVSLRASPRAWAFRDETPLELVFLLDDAAPARHGGRSTTVELVARLHARLLSGGIVSRLVRLDAAPPDDLFGRTLPAAAASAGACGVELTVLLDHYDSPRPAAAILTSALPPSIDAATIDRRLAEMGAGAAPLVDGGVDGRVLVQLVVECTASLSIARETRPANRDERPWDAYERPASRPPDLRWAAEAFRLFAAHRPDPRTRALAAGRPPPPPGDFEAVDLLLSRTLGRLGRGESWIDPAFSDPLTPEAIGVAWSVARRAPTFPLVQRRVGAFVERALAEDRFAAARQAAEQLLTLEVAGAGRGPIPAELASHLFAAADDRLDEPLAESDEERRRRALRLLLAHRPDHAGAALELGFDLAARGRTGHDEAAAWLLVALASDDLGETERRWAELVLAWLLRDAEAARRTWDALPPAARRGPLIGAIGAWIELQESAAAR